MSGIPNISGSTTQNVSSGAKGGALDTQGRFTFGGITTTGYGGSTSTNGVQSYVAMAIIAVVVVAAAMLLLKR